MSTTTGSGSLLRRAAGALVGLEAAAMVAVAAWFAVSTVTRDDAGAMSASLAALALVGGVGLGWAWRALWRGSTSARGLALTWQVLQCAAGVTLIEWSVVAGVGAIVVGLAAAALLVVDARREVAAIDTRGPDGATARGDSD